MSALDKTLAKWLTPVIFGTADSYHSPAQKGSQGEPSSSLPVSLTRVNHVVTHSVTPSVVQMHFAREVESEESKSGEGYCCQLKS